MSHRPEIQPSAIARRIKDAKNFFGDVVAGLGFALTDGDSAPIGKVLSPGARNFEVTTINLKEVQN